MVLLLTYSIPYPSWKASCKSLLSNYNFMYNKATLAVVLFYLKFRAHIMKNSFSSLSDLASMLGQDSPKPDKESNTTSNDDSLVYSTDKGRIKQASKSTQVTPSDGFAKVRRETKGRKGKGVVTISGLGLSASELKSLASKLKKTCGSGGSVVGETIEIQGDKRDAIKTALEKQGFKVKFIGG